MRLSMPIGAPGLPGPVNRQLVAAQGTYSLAGQVAIINYTQTTGLIDPRSLDATNTGAVLGGTFTNSSVTGVSAAGTYTNINYTNGLTVIPNNVNDFILFRNCKFSGIAGNSTVQVPDGGSTPRIPTNVHFEYCTFDDKGIYTVNGLTGAFTTAFRCYFSGYDNCFNLYDPCTITECCNSGFMGPDGAGNSHYDCIENNGVPNVTVQSCKFINNKGQTAVIQLNNYGGTCSNFLADNCYFEGGGYTLYADNTFNNSALPQYAMQNIRYTRCIIKSGAFGREASYGSQVSIPTTGPNANTLI